MLTWTTGDRLLVTICAGVFLMGLSSSKLWCRFPPRRVRRPDPIVIRLEGATARSGAYRDTLLRRRLLHRAKGER